MLEALEAAGCEAWCVGGCVRDLRLGRTPGDWDVTTNALPEQTLALFKDRAIPTGLQHGTVTVRTPERAVEIFRSHGGNLPAALVRDAYRDGQSVKLVTLDEFPFAEVQMTTVVIVGNSETIARDGKLYVRRGYKEKYGLEK